MSITKDRKTEIIDQFRLDAQDTGSPEVQVALLTARITELTEHLRAHKKDYACRRGLLMLVGRRRRLLDYLKKVEMRRYMDIIHIGRRKGGTVCTCGKFSARFRYVSAERGEFIFRFCGRARRKDGRIQAPLPIDVGGLARLGCVQYAGSHSD